MAGIAPRDRLIVALDMPTVEEARALVARLGAAVTFYKIGLELVMAGGLELARELAGSGKRVFLDMKLLDIENTVARGPQCRRESEQRSSPCTRQDRKTLRAAVSGRAGTGLKVLGVTVLTNLDAGDLREQGIDASPADLVVRRATLARDAGCDGVVASGHEAARVRADCRAAHGDRDPGHPLGRRRGRRPGARDHARAGNRGGGRLHRGRTPYQRVGRSGSGGTDLHASDRAGTGKAPDPHPELRHPRKANKQEETHAKGLRHRPGNRHQSGGVGPVRRQGRRSDQEIRRQPDRARRQAEIVEGEGVARNVVIEFASFEAARAYAHSPEYAAAKKLRQGAGTLDIASIVRGVLTWQARRETKGAHRGKPRC